MIPLERAEAELTVVNSRFIATIGPVRTSEAARAFIYEMREKYADATHNVPAYLIERLRSEERRVGNACRSR